MNWYLKVLKKYAVFYGRAQRKEYWYFFLFNALISFVLRIGAYVRMDNPDFQGGIISLAEIYSLAILIPSLAVFVRRLHDIGHSAWWLFILLVPFVNLIFILVFLVRDSQPGENQYGPNPKEEKISLPEEIERGNK